MRYCLADFFLLQKKKEITAGLIRENKIAGIACRVAASSNKPFHSDGYKQCRSNGYSILQLSCWCEGLGFYPPPVNSALQLGYLQRICLLDDRVIPAIKTNISSG